MNDAPVAENATEEVEETAPLTPTKYELMLIVSGLISDEDIKKEVATVKALLGDDVVFEEAWGMRPFAYRMKNQDKGYYIVWNFMQTPDVIKDMKAQLKLMPNIVRHLIMKVPENYTPMALADIEAGLEKLREQKAEKRGRGKNKPTGKKKTDKPAPAPEKKAEEKAPEAAPTAEKEAPAPAEEKKAEPAVEAKEEPKADDKKKSLDEKLEDILSDADLGL